MAATKDQERQALQQIRQIVEDLGDDSYIATAFDGAWELAEENIENDFGKSCAWYINRCCELKMKNTGLSDVIKNLEDELNDRKELIAALEKRIVDLEKSLDSEYKACEDLNNDMLALRHLVELKNLEIMKLKAKLFDLMFSGD